MFAVCDVSKVSDIGKAFVNSHLKLENGNLAWQKVHFVKKLFPNLNFFLVCTVSL